METHHIGPSSVGSNAVNLVQVDDVALMAAEKYIRVQPCLRLPQAVAGFVASAAHGVDHGGAVLPLHQQNIAHVQERHPFPMMEHQPPAGHPGRFPGKAGKRLFIHAKQPVPGTLQGLHHPLHLEGLNQVIKGIDLKGIAHVLVMGGGEDQHHGGVHILNDPGALHTAFTRHLHIQKADLWMVLFHQLQQGVAIRGLAHQGKSLHPFQHVAHHQAHPRVIVRQHDLDRVHGHFSFSSFSCPGGCAGHGPFMPENAEGLLFFLHAFRRLFLTDTACVHMAASGFRSLRKPGACFPG